MPVTAQIERNLVRLMAVRLGAEPSSALEALGKFIRWPEGEHSQSRALIGNALKHLGYNHQAIASRHLSDMFHIVFNLRFVMQPGEFYEGWREQFTACDLSNFLPFASDDYYFYFLSLNPDDERDPLVFKLDHEAAHEPPSGCNNLTIGAFLESLQPGESEPGCLSW